MTDKNLVELIGIEGRIDAARIKILAPYLDCEYSRDAEKAFSDMLACLQRARAAVKQAMVYARRLEAVTSAAEESE